MTENDKAKQEGKYRDRRPALEFSLLILLAIMLVSGILYLSDWQLKDPAVRLLIALIWPIFLVIAAIVFRSQLRTLIELIQVRIRQGAGFKIAGVELTASTRNIPVPSSQGTVTPDNIALLHTSFFSERGTKEKNNGLAYYQIEVIVVAPEAVLSRVSRVTYRLPEPWPADLRKRVVSDRSTRFKMKDLANGTAIVTAEVEIEGQDAPIHLNRFIDLRPDGPRI